MNIRRLAQTGVLAVVAVVIVGVSFAQSAPDDVKELKEQVAKQQRQIEELTRRLDQLTKTPSQPGDETASQPGTPSNSAAPEPVSKDTRSTLFNRPLVASTTPMVPPMPVNVSPSPIINSSAQGAPESAPLQFKLGDAYFTPLGFMDFTSVYRNHDAGGGIGTSFGSIPYGNVYQNKLNEDRLSMQNSRVGVRIDALVKGAHVIGYVEADFLGNNAASVAVTSNSNTLRSRVYWVDISKSQWEVLAGQTWSLITPGRTGISPLPGNIFYSQNIDVNYQAGLVWGRIPELRFVYHPSSKMAFAIALDNQEQYVGGSGGGGTTVFPSTLTATYPGAELNNANTTVSAPAVFPDTIVKAAFDPTTHVHFELGGVVREFRVWNPNNSNHYTSAGGGGFANLNVELVKGFRLLTNNYYSDGGGRYIFGLAPDLVAHSDGSLSLIHSGSTVSGFEWTIKNTLVYAYYGGVYIQRNVVIDTTVAKPVLVGYGYTGSSSGQNRSIQEATFGFNHTIWRDAKWGAVNFMGQYSYLTRDPWYVATGQPSNANVNMLFFDLRYTLPGSAPAIH